MKKTYISYINGVACLAQHNGEEEFALYTGVEPVEGEWILETAGDPVSLNSLEEAGASEMIPSMESFRMIPRHGRNSQKAIWNTSPIRFGSGGCEKIGTSRAQVWAG